MDHTSGNRPPFDDRPSLCIASPFPPPYGGMAVQAEKLALALEKNGWLIYRIPINQTLGRHLSFLGRIPGVRTLLRTLYFLHALGRCLNHCDTLYLLSGFFGYFLWVSAPAILMAKLHRKRIILSARGGAAGKYFQRHAAWVRPLVGMLDAVTTPSPFLKNEFERYFGISAFIIPNIADLEQFHYRQRRSIEPRILCSRNLEPIYNVSCAIRAFSLIRKHYSKAIMGIAGDGSERKQLQELCHELGISDAVAFLGQRPHSAMPRIYDEYDILINSSNEDNLPGVILEAFAAGLPVVSTNAGGIPYLVENGSTGLLVEKDNPSALADAVLMILRDPVLAHRITASARRETARYSQENAVAAMTQLLQKRNIPGQNPPAQENR